MTEFPFLGGLNYYLYTKRQNVKDENENCQASLEKLYINYHWKTFKMTYFKYFRAADLH